MEFNIKRRSEQPRVVYKCLKCGQEYSLLKHLLERTRLKCNAPSCFNDPNARLVKK